MSWTKRLGWAWLAVGLLGFLCGAVPADGASREPRPRKIPTLLLGVARTTFQVRDQEHADPKPLWIPRLGLTYAAQRDNVAAFEFGLWADARGGEWKDKGSGVKAASSLAVDRDYTHRLRLVYLAVPLMMRFSVPRPFLTPYVRAGIAPNLLLLAKGESWETATGHITQEYQSVRHQVRPFGLDALAGVGVRANVARRAFILEALYLQGLTDVLKKGPSEAHGHPRSQSLQAYFGIGLTRERPAK